MQFSQSCTSVVSCISPDKEVVGDELHLLRVEDAVKSAGNATVWKISHSDTDHHLLEYEDEIGQQQPRLLCVEDTRTLLVTYTIQNLSVTCSVTLRPPYTHTACDTSVAQRISAIYDLLRPLRR